MLHRSFLFDMTFFLISFTICFSVGLLLSAMLIYRDVWPYIMNWINDRSRLPYSLESALATLFGVVQGGVSIAGIIAIAFALRSKGDMYWVDMAVRCNLHVLTGTNVR